jgi:polyferredoxin
MQLPVLDMTQATNGRTEAARTAEAAGPFLKPEGRVLATLEQDGRRRWLRPKPSNGPWWRQRLVVAWALIVLYTVIPWTKVDGMPTILLDLVERKFVFFGAVFRPTETLLFALLFLSVFFGIFLLTAVFGRVWCGWACPQTVYMEFVYRPLERLFLGKAYANPKASVSPWRRVAMYAAFVVVSAHLANTFLAWFVGADRLTEWIFTSTPFEHPVAFAVFAAITGLMLFDFLFFREQLCALVCPYGRFQSALLDKDSLTVAYDRARGEPRGKGTRRAPRKCGGGGCGGSGKCSGGGGGGGCGGGGGGCCSTRAPQDAAHDATAAMAAVEEPAPRGDCIDCTLCVQTCPAGIDIRDGLQLECIQCTQCIDACDAVMEKIGRPKGLIRYSSERAIEHAPRKRVRVRLIVYPVILVALLAGVVVLAVNRQPAFVAVLRTQGIPYTVREQGTPAAVVESTVRLRVDNCARDARTYLVEGGEGVRLVRAERITVARDASAEVDVVVLSDPSEFALGRRKVALHVRDEAGGDRDFDGVVEVGVLGPIAGGLGGRDRGADGKESVP